MSEDSEPGILAIIGIIAANAIFFWGLVHGWSLGEILGVLFLAAVSVLFFYGVFKYWRLEGDK